MAFIQGRQILDGALITVHWLKKSKEKGVFVKHDFRKAYDSVCWSFVDHVMKMMGFGEV